MDYVLNLKNNNVNVRIDTTLLHPVRIRSHFDEPYLPPKCVGNT